MEREKNKSFYTHEETIIDVITGEILNYTQKTITKTSAEPDFIKVYYETMMAFNQIHDIPISFVLSLSKFIGWTNEGCPQTITLNKFAKETISKDCGVDTRQIERYIKKSVDNGLLFRTKYRGVYEINPFMIAKGKWESIKRLRANYDFTNGQWKRIIESKTENDETNNKIQQNLLEENIPGQLELKDCL